jgi:radical SAM protein with 4Fe4S-binding SPASM domain
MNYKETLKNSINRVNKLVNESIKVDSNGVPLPSWIEISPIDICNRVCAFCPKSDDSVAPNQNQRMPKILYNKIANELKDLGFQGTIMIAGYGEPLLNKDVIDMSKVFSEFCNVEVTTNGDPLNEKFIKELYEAGVSKLIISMYDGEHQIAEYNELFKKANIDTDKYILRDRWYTKEDNYGVKLTNRAGVLNSNTVIKKDSQCFYPFYSMMVDWNGDVFLCTQDWNRRIKSGNLMLSTVYEVWTSKMLKKYRTHLNDGKRDLPPCNTCDADGTLHGKEYVAIWEKFYERNK